MWPDKCSVVALHLKWENHRVIFYSDPLSHGIMEKTPPGVSLSLITLGVNSDGSGPNFVDPPTLAPVVRGIGVIIAIVSTLFVAARLASKIHTTRVLSLDDCTSPAFLIFCGLWQYTHLLQRL